MLLHRQLAQQTGHLLRLRVLQEIELLADRVRCRPEGAYERPILRRLTRTELKHIKDTGVIPYPSAVALLIVPPLNKDPRTKQRPQPNRTGYPDSQGAHSIPIAPRFPLSQLYSAGASPSSTEDAVPKHPHPQIPLYNGASLFPSRPQRAALHISLGNLLSVERCARHRSQLRPTPAAKDTTYDGRALGDQKASHAYLLCSDAETLLRADAVPLAIALWRVRMWEDVDF